MARARWWRERESRSLGAWSPSRDPGRLDPSSLLCLEATPCKSYGSHEPVIRRGTSQIEHLVSTKDLNARFQLSTRHSLRYRTLLPPQLLRLNPRRLLEPHEMNPSSRGQVSLHRIRSPDVKVTLRCAERRELDGGRGSCCPRDLRDVRARLDEGSGEGDYLADESEDCDRPSAPARVSKVPRGLTVGPWTYRTNLGMPELVFRPIGDEMRAESILSRPSQRFDESTHPG